MTNRTQLSSDAISGTTTGYVVDPGTGDKMEATFTDIGESEQKELEGLENKAKNGDADAATELNKKVINEYNHDDITYEECGVAMRQAILVGFMRALGDSNQAVDEAEEFFEAVSEAQGNA